MRKDGTWGTTEEIFSAAALLKTTIYTWNRFGERLCWNRHGHNKENINNFGIYIDNSSGIHYDIVLSIGKNDIYFFITNQRSDELRMFPLIVIQEFNHLRVA